MHQRSSVGREFWLTDCVLALGACEKATYPFYSSKRFGMGECHAKTRSLGQGWKDSLVELLPFLIALCGKRYNFDSRPTF